MNNQEWKPISEASYNDMKNVFSSIKIKNIKNVEIFCSKNSLKDKNYIIFFAKYRGRCFEANKKNSFNWEKIAEEINKIIGV